MRSALVLALLSSLLAACGGGKAVVMVSPSYDAARVKRAAVVTFTDFPGYEGSGGMAADVFEKYLLWGGYTVVDRRQVENQLAGMGLQSPDQLDAAAMKQLGDALKVDALVLGRVTSYVAPRDQTVMVDEPQEQSDPIYGTVTTEQRVDGARVRTRQQVVTGYAVTTTSQMVPETETLPASAALSVKMVGTNSGEVLWNGSGMADAVDLNAAVEQASAQLMQAVVKKLKK